MSNNLSLDDLGMNQDFLFRHIGSSSSQQEEMLSVFGYKTLDELTDVVLPQSIQHQQALNIHDSQSEVQSLEILRSLANKNKNYRHLIGMGYYGTQLPPVIARNVLENPSWYTAYTPYQAEISQGRLEALLNYQQLTMDLTGFDLASASLLDEATAAAEAMMLARRVSKNKASQLFFLADDVFPQVKSVVQTRARHLGIECIVAPPEKVCDYDVFGALFQQSNSFGEIKDLTSLIESVQSKKGIVAIATDLLALMLLKSPADLGADIAFGSSQRFGVSMGYGGPHAAFFATRSAFKRSMPGRVIGVSKDSRDQPALRMAMQTREQHIRREKANSNICTAQVLLANIASFYAVYHGVEGLTKIAQRVHRLTNILALGLQQSEKVKVLNTTWFDTLTLKVENIEEARQRADEAKINLRYDIDGTVGLTLDECSTAEEISQLWQILLGDDHGCNVQDLDALCRQENHTSIPAKLLRTDAVLQHKTFQAYRSETEMLRYIKRLERKDLALDQAMIPLGSCTMKLNATSQMMPISWPEFTHMHPFCPLEQSQGYQELIQQLEHWLCDITGYDAISMQPNSGAQGEYAGLIAIKNYLASQGQSQRDICLIPSSAHGTNPASAVLVGMNVITVACDSQGNISVEDLTLKIEQNRDRLACLMITYPSTHGVFESNVIEVCQMIHDAGGQVYLDGANLNAQVGLTSPGFIGADVSHLNLHKTFAIPHGGGGPGMGPIGVKKHLADFLPKHILFSENGSNDDTSVSAAPWGSAGILPISWMYLATLGANGLKKSTQVAILHANYICKKLSEHYDILYTGDEGFVAHEGIIDCRSFKASAGITEVDIAKRLMDYGFHAPTMSFPVTGTLMIEPTESESKQELDRFIDAMISIREEIRMIELGEYSKENNPLVFAPHTIVDLTDVSFSERSYSKEIAAFPRPYLYKNKFWPTVNRLNDAYGDRNFCCHCVE